MRSLTKKFTQTKVNISVSLEVRKKVCGWFLKCSKYVNKFMSKNRRTCTFFVYMYLKNEVYVKQTVQNVDEREKLFRLNSKRFVWRTSFERIREHFVSYATWLRFSKHLQIFFFFHRWRRELFTKEKLSHTDIHSRKEKKRTRKSHILNIVESF